MMMKFFRLPFPLFTVALVLLASCNPNPYAATNRVYKKKMKAYAKELRATPVLIPGEDSLQRGDYWVASTNFNLRKPNYVVIHHTAQNSTEQTLKIFTNPKTQVSSHYVIGRDGKVYHMLNDYLRAWHGGSAQWGTTTDLNSTSIGIELDNNGFEPFQETQIESLIKVLALLKKNYGIPAANFIGHSDIAPSRKVDPNPTFPWEQLAEAGFGLWYDEEKVEQLVLEKNILEADAAIDSIAYKEMADSLQQQNPAQDQWNILGERKAENIIPASFNPRDALKIIGYDVKNLDAAIKAFKLHYIQKEVNATLTDRDLKVLYLLYLQVL